MQLISFQIQECFGFRDSGRVDLKDTRNFIYVLGRNSSGKTSFLTALAHFAPDLIPQTHPNFVNFNSSSGVPYLIGEYEVGIDGFTLEADADSLTLGTEEDDYSAISRKLGYPFWVKMDSLNSLGLTTSSEYQQLRTALIRQFTEIYAPFVWSIERVRKLWVRRTASGMYQFSTTPSFEDTILRLRQKLPILLEDAAKRVSVQIQGHEQILTSEGWKPIHYLTPEEMESLLVCLLPKIAWFNQSYPLLNTLPKALKNEHIQSSDPLTNVFIEYLGREDIVQLLTGEDPFELEDILKKLQEKVDVLMGKVNQSSPKGKELLTLHLSLRDGLQITMLTDKKRSFYRHLSDNTKFLFAYHLYQEVHNLNGNILLFDEPNNGFHATAQDQLLIFLNSLAEQGNLVIVSTHSEHLIDPDYLTCVRLMTTDSKGFLHIRNKWYGQTEDRNYVQAIRPILDAIGLRYGANKLTIRDKVIVTEGLTELLYLRALRRLLGYEGELHLAPGTGDKKLMPLVALIISQGLRFKVLIDTTRKGKSAKTELQDAYGIPDTAICEVEIPAQFPQAKGSGIEDIFSKNDFAKLLANVEHMPSDDFKTLTNGEYMRRCEAMRILPKRVVAHNFSLRITDMHIDEETEKNARRLLDFCMDDKWFLL